MTQFNFTTNIEKRMPDTGKVFCIDRMTSGYAEQHPLDVDSFIESVYQEFAGTEFEESREVLRSVWTAVLSVTSPRGDASLYPNENGRKRAAAMKVWHKAGDYWRRGFRHGDTLPDMVPMTKITRLNDGGWIALFPKDKYLLEDGEKDAPIVITESRNDEIALKSEPKRSKARNIAAKAARRNVITESRYNDTTELKSDNHHWLTTAGYLAAASVALFVIYETGLLIPLGLIGLATGGLLK